MAYGDECQGILIYEDRRLLDGGYILQGRIWRVPKPVVGSRHPFKYSLFFGLPGDRLVLYDNERLKGDHRHYGPLEEPYRFRGIPQLLQDFAADVRCLTDRPFEIVPGS